MLHRIHDGGRLVSAMHHAIGAFFVIAGTVGVPVGLLHQLLECLRIAFAQQIAGALPAKIIARRIAPGGAMIGLVSRKEIEKQARLIERPAAPRIALENFAKQFLGAAAIEEMLL